MKGKCFSAVNMGQRKKNDFYQTPYSMTEQLLKKEFFTGDVIDPASGKGAIIKVLKNSNIFKKVSCNEITDMVGIDFTTFEDFRRFDNIITNPPFSLALEFIEKAKQLYKKKIAMLLPLSYLHGQKRYEKKIFNELSAVYVFTRYPMLEDTIREDGKYSTGMIAYAWYIWTKYYCESPKIKWIDNQLYILTSKDKTCIN